MIFTNTNGVLDILDHIVRPRNTHDQTRGTVTEQILDAQPGQPT